MYTTTALLLFQEHVFSGLLFVHHFITFLHYVHTTAINIIYFKQFYWFKFVTTVHEAIPDNKFISTKSIHFYQYLFELSELQFIRTIIRFYVNLIKPYKMFSSE